MRLGELLAEAGYVPEDCLRGGLEEKPLSLEIDSVTDRTADIRPGSLFICLDGHLHDGHDFAAAALQKGAAGIVTERNTGVLLPPGKVEIRLPHTRPAYAMLAAALAGHPERKLRMVAVTGTNGKTTTAVLMTAILRQAGCRVETIGTLSGAMTTPDPDVLYPHLRQCAAEGTQWIVMEASSHALVQQRLQPLLFEAGIFTNLSPEHMDYHRDMEDYYRAKASLFCRCLRGVCNLDDPYGARLYASLPAARGGYCVRQPAEAYYRMGAIWQAESLRMAVTTGLDFSCIENRREKQMIHSAMPWRFSVYNTLAAISCARLLGIPWDAIRAGIAEVPGIPGRLEKLKLPPGEKGEKRPSVYIDYAHTPDALENALRSLRDVMDPADRLTVVFGCGGERDAEKRPAMGRIASRLADYVIVTEDNSRGEDPQAIIRAVVKGLDREKPYEVIPDRGEAIRQALRNAGNRDVILLAGKGHEDYLIDATGKHPFSEKAIVEAFYRR